MSDYIVWSLNAALVICALLLAVCTVRMYLGPTIVDRLQAIDTITTLLIGIIVLLTLRQNHSLFFDAALALAAFAFVGTLAAARAIAEGRS